MKLKAMIAKSRSRTRLVVVTICLAALVAFVVISVNRWRRVAEKPPNPRITVSKETTRALGPLDEDGYVDYAAVLNHMASDGVTNENNAGVLFIQVCRAQGFPATDRDRFFQLLGIQPLSRQRDHFKELGQLTKEQQAALDRSLREPWKARDFRFLAGWLKSNEPTLALVVAGTRRDRCYLPWVVPPGRPLFDAPLTVESQSRDWAWALVLRATLRLSEGRVAAAQDDLFTCHRLARLIGQSPCLIGALTCDTIDALAFEGDAAVMNYGKLSAHDALVYQGKLRALPPLPVVADIFDRYERLAVLDMMKVTIRDNGFKPLADLFPPSLWQTASESMTPCWDEAFRVANTEYDKWAASARLPAPDRQRAFDRLATQLKAEASDLMSREPFDKTAAPNQLQTTALRLIVTARSAVDPTLPRQVEKTMRESVPVAQYGRQYGKICFYLFLPAIKTACLAEDRARARETLEQVGLALVAYRADRGAYPAKLESLAPRYVAQGPRDPCTGQPLRYVSQGDRCRLYSIGTNGIDEGGRTFDSRPPGDDVVLEIVHDQKMKR